MMNLRKIGSSGFAHKVPKIGILGTEGRDASVVSSVGNADCLSLIHKLLDLLAKAIQVNRLLHELGHGQPGGVAVLVAETQGESVVDRRQEHDGQAAEVAANGAGDVKAGRVVLGEHDVEDHRVGAALADSVDGLVGVGLGGRLVAVTLEHRAHRAGKILIVVYDQYVCHDQVSRCQGSLGASPQQAGKSRVNSVPCCGALSTRTPTLPAMATWRTMARPRPVEALLCFTASAVR